MEAYFESDMYKAIESGIYPTCDLCKKNQCVTIRIGDIFKSQYGSNYDTYEFDIDDKLNILEGINKICDNCIKDLGKKRIFRSSEDYMRTVDLAEGICHGSIDFIPSDRCLEDVKQTLLDYIKKISDLQDKLKIEN
jgi:hypothetical protein